MPRRGRIAAWSLGLLLGLPALLLALLLLVGNTAPGRRLIVDLVPRVSGGTLALEDLHGRFPDRLRAFHAELRDEAGSYATIEGLALDWHPLALLHRELRIDRLTADRVTLMRLPASSAGSSTTSAGPRIDIETLQIERLDLAAALAGTASSLAVTGTLHLASLDEIQGQLTARRSDAPGSYELSGRIDANGLVGHFAAAEPAHGMLSELAGLPELGALSLNADLAGPRNAERVTITAEAGPLAAHATGLADLVGQSLDLDVSGTSPQMAPSPTISWQSAALDAHVHGSFTSPDASGRLEIAGLRAGDATSERLLFDLSGSGGRLDFDGSIAALRLPGPQPDLLAASPLALKAEMRLDDPARPVQFSLSHPLLAAEGHADTGATPSGAVTARIADLRPFANLAGADLAGQATVDASLAQHDSTLSLSASGTIALTGGTAQAVQMIGDQGRFDIAATVQGDDIALDHFTLDGRRGSAEMSGSAKQGVADLAWHLAIADIAPLAPSFTGNVDARGTLQGGMNALAVAGEADATLATQGFARSPVHISLNADGLPAQPKGRVTAQGTLDRAKLQLAVAFSLDSSGTPHFVIDRADWRSLSASGDVTVPTGLLPIGTLRLRIGTLADLAPFIGTGAAGSLDAAIDLVPQGRTSQARIRATADNVMLAGTSVRHLALEGTIDDPLNRQVTALRLTADGLLANGLSGSAQLEADGPATGVALKLGATLQQADQAVSVAATGLLSLPRYELSLATLTASYGALNSRLLAPARLSFASGFAVDRLRLGIDRATLEIAGRLAPTLDLTASTHDLSLALAKPFFPELAMQGTASADARLTGTMAAPTGTIRLAATGIKLGTGLGTALPPASIQANARLASGAARLDAKLTAGNRAQLALSGQAPLDLSSPVDLRTTGTIDLALLTPLLAASGRSVLGRVTLDAAIGGTLATPRITGTAQLANGDFQDHIQGIHVAAIEAALQADGETLRLQRFSGRAGSGSIAASGTIGLIAPGMPVAIEIEAQNARALQSDLITATLGGHLTVRGQASDQLALAGRLVVSRAEIDIPDSFPPSVATLPVRIAGRDQPQAPRAAAVSLTLDLVIDAPQQVFVRGHGLDAEMGGSLRITGNTSAPQIIGGLDMRHGTLSLAGETLTFTSGKVSFEGGTVTGKLDPALNFVAQTVSGGVTATLTITGYADQPKIVLTSTPELPQDEVLAHLLFGQSVKQLGPLQLAEIAEALASFGGSGIGNPLAAVRKGLGLDRLNFGSSGSGTGGTVEAGKYVANGVYVGAKQGTSGGTQAQVQIDITKHLKLETTLGNGSAPVTGATPQNDPGSSVGLTYQFEY